MNQVYEALAQVRTIHRHILEKQRFKGYSGRARALSGTLGLALAVALSRLQPQNPNLVVACWVGLAVLAAVINYGAVVVWYLREGESNAANLRPALENLPALAAGALLTLSLWQAQALSELPAVWMLLFGLANLSARHVVAKGTGWVGLYYVLAGSVMALLPHRVSILNPWPMGLVFFVGEWAGAWIFHADGRKSDGWAGVLGLAQGGDRHE